MPSCSIGFWVAITMNGVPSGYVTVSTVTCRSSMHSSSADCVLGLARLISSPRTMLAKIAPGLELEVALLLVEDVHAGDVGGQEVRRELDAPERTVDRAGDRLREHRLADARHVLDQQVALGDQGDEREADLGVLALDDLLDVAFDLTEPGGEALPVLWTLTYLQGCTSGATGG